MQTAQRQFIQLNKEMAATWRPSRLFCFYLNLLTYNHSRGLERSDKQTLEDVAQALNDRPLPEKFAFYHKISDSKHKQLYYKRFLQVV